MENKDKDKLKELEIKLKQELSEEKINFLLKMLHKTYGNKNLIYKAYIT